MHGGRDGGDISAAELNRQVDDLLKHGRLPDIAGRCAEIEDGAQQYLQKVNADVQAEVNSKSAALRERISAILQKQERFHAHYHEFIKRCGVLYQQAERNHRALQERAQLLRQSVDERKQQLERLDQERWASLTLEIRHLLDTCRRNINDGGGAGEQQQHYHHHQNPSLQQPLMPMNRF